METKRIPLAAVLAPRSSAVDTDGILQNCYKESTPLGDMIVKRPGLEFSWNAGLGCAQGAISYNGIAFIVRGGGWGVTEQASPTYSPGTTWNVFTVQPEPAASLTLANSKIGYLVSLGDNLYSIGAAGLAGAQSFSVYKSTNHGTSWSGVVAGGTFTAIRGQAAAVLGSYLYAYLSGDVRKTADGTTWTALSSNLPAQVFGHMVAHSDGKLYFFTGAAGGTAAVYSSADGVTWATVTSSPGWAGRTGMMVWALGANLYVAGGLDGGGLTPVHDVWKSTDNGANWTQITAAAAFSARAYSAAWTYNSLLWIGAGQTNSGGTTAASSLYSSPDGITWTLVNSNFAGLSFARMTYCVHNNTMYVGSGYNTTPRTSQVAFYADGATNPEPGDITTTAFSPSVSTCTPFTLAVIPALGTTPEKVFLKTSTVAWVYDGTSMTHVTDSDYPATTVPGVVYLDGSIYVMTSDGIIYGSDLNDPLSWNALNFISANSEAGFAVGLARQLNYIVAFKSTSTEFFYDAGNATGSPLGKVQNALLSIGSASAGSFAFADNTVYFVANSAQKGRSVMKLEGYTPKVISTPYIDRILNADDMSEVYAFVVKSNGHFFYVLTLVDTGITLVFDEVSGEWHTWTTMAAGSPASTSSLVVQDDGSILVTMPLAHDQGDGDVVTIAGATPSAANGTFNLRYDIANDSVLQFTYVPDSAVTGAITGTVTATFYTETYFPGVYYAYGDGVDYLLDIASGKVYTFSPTIYEDNSNPIDLIARLGLLDLGTMATKRYNRFELVGDKETTNVLVRFSDDDYESWGLYRTIPMAQKRAKISNLGSGRRRAYELRHTGNTPLRLLAAELDFDVGAF